MNRCIDMISFKCVLRLCVVSAAVAFSLVSCALDNPLDAGARDSEEVAFGVSFASAPSTKADDMRTLTLVGEDGNREVSVFKAPIEDVLGTAVPSGPATKGEPVTEMYSTFDFTDGSTVWTATKKADGLYKPPFMRYRDLAGGSTLVAPCWSPAEPNGFELDLSNHRFVYSTPSDVRDEEDFVFALSPAITASTSGDVALTFSHVMAGIQVWTGNAFPRGGVETMWLENIYLGGTFDISDGSWTSDAASKGNLILIDDFVDVYSIDDAVYPNSAINGHVTDPIAMVEGERTAMLMPQVFPDGAKLCFNLNFAGPVFHYELDLSGQELEPGKMFVIAADGSAMFAVEGTGRPGAVLSFGNQKNGSYGNIADATCTVGEDGKFRVVLSNSTRFTISSDDIYTVTKMPAMYMTPYGNAPQFRSCHNLTSVCDFDAYNIPDVSEMFIDCTSLVHAPMFDTSKCVNFSNMFRGCSSLETIPDYDTSSGVNFSSMFYQCSSLNELPDLDLRNGTDFSYTFFVCYSLPYDEVKDLDFTHGTNFEGTFKNCWSFMSDTPLEFDFANAEKLNYTFQGCDNMVDVVVSTPKGEEFAGMFQNCKKMESLSGIDFSHGWKFNSTFENCYALYDLPVMDLTHAYSMSNMFYECRALPEVYLTSTRDCQQMQYAFYKCALLDGSDIHGLDCTSATNMDYTFACTALTGIDLVSTDNCRSMNYTFSTTPLADIANVQNLNLGVQTSLNYTFDSTALTSFPVTSFPACVSAEGMLRNCGSLQTVGALSMPANINFKGMFENDYALTTIGDIVSTSGQNFSNMLKSLSSVTRIPQMDTSHGTNFRDFINRCTVLEDVPEYDFSSASNVVGIFWECPAIVNVGGFPGLSVSFALNGHLNNAPSMTRASLLNIINGLEDMSGLDPDETAPTLSLLNAHYANLTAADIAIATAKNWNVVHSNP